MIRGAKPAPLNLSPPPKARLDARRGSLAPKFAYPPPSSAFDWDEEEGRLRRLGTRVRRAHRGITTDRRTRMLRLALDGAHMLVCVVPALVVAVALGQGMAALAGPVALFVVIVADIALDLQSIYFYDRPWAGWCLMLRAATAVAYIGIFASFAAGGVFAHDSAAAAVYICLWALAAWSVVHTFVNRQRVASEVRRYFNKLTYRTTILVSQRGRTTSRTESWGWRAESEPRSVTEIIYTPTVVAFDEPKPEKIGYEYENKFENKYEHKYENKYDFKNEIHGRNKSGSVSSTGSSDSASSGWSGHTYASLGNNYTTALRVPPTVAPLKLPAPVAHAHAPIFTTPQKMTVVPLITVEYPLSNTMNSSNTMKRAPVLNTKRVPVLDTSFAHDKIMTRSHAYGRWPALASSPLTTDSPTIPAIVAPQPIASAKRSSKTAVSVYSLASRASSRVSRLVTRASWVSKREEGERAGMAF